MNILLIALLEYFDLNTMVLLSFACKGKGY